MTGKDLIIYILKNNLENELVITESGKFIGFMDEKEAAVKFDVGVSTIKLWHCLGRLKGVEIGNSIFFFRDAVDPRLL